jgi:hypothetical protein
MDFPCLMKSLCFSSFNLIQKEGHEEPKFLHVFRIACGRGMFGNNLIYLRSWLLVKGEEASGRDLVKA